MHTEKEHRKFTKADFKDYILAGDIGGTNTTLGLFGIKKGIPLLLTTFHFKSQQLRGLVEAVKVAFK